MGFLINLASDWVVSRPAEAKQRKIDSQLAQLYQGELSKFFWQFRVNLNWCLPRGERMDAKIEEVFHYDTELANKPLDLGRMNRDTLQYLFTKYDFTQPMLNYKGDRVEPEVEPTGFHHFLGNLERFSHEVEIHLQKYSSTASPELCRRIEFAHKLAKAQADGIKLDLVIYNALSKPEADSVADFVMQLRNDWLETNKEYGGGNFPILAGKVVTSHATEGTLGVTWEYGKYKKGKWATEK